MKSKLDIQLSSRTNSEQQKIIDQASEILGLSISSFVRSCALKTAREILKENKGVNLN